MLENDLQENFLKMHILVVDDHEDNLDLILALLEDHGYENLHTAKDGRKALDLIEGPTHIDLVLLDINMPVMNGYEVLEYMSDKEELRLIPVIMVTALDQLDSVIRCIEGGAEDYLTKPVEETLLQARVGASLERKFLRDQERRLFRQVEKEKRKSETVLFNVLPRSIAERLKKGEDNIAENIPDATVLFADLVGFTKLSSQISPDTLLYILNHIFSAFDKMVLDFRLEKIKTIGDSYMVVGGIPPNVENHVENCLEFAYASLHYMNKFNGDHNMSLQLRIGMHVGPIVAGVIGQTRFSYDLWGETVNLASRMESLGLPGTIQVSEEVYQRLSVKDGFAPRGVIEVKGKGSMTTYISTLESQPEAAGHSLDEGLAPPVS